MKAKYTFERARGLLLEYAEIEYDTNPRNWSNEGHYIEWSSLVAECPEPTFESIVEWMIENRGFEGYTDQPFYWILEVMYDKYEVYWDDWVVIPEYIKRYTDWHNEQRRKTMA